MKGVINMNTKELFKEERENKTTFMEVKTTFKDDPEVYKILHVDHRVEYKELLLEAEKVRRLGQIAKILEEKL